jgi:diguanylate cyclase (GGDEF)-like protein/PAS domain S-box-containing protein
MSEIDIFSHAPVAMAVVGCDGNLLRVNRALSDLLGYPAEQLIGRTLESLSHPNDAGRTAVKLQNLLIDGSATFQFEGQYLHATGRTLWVLLTVSLFRNAHGVPVSFLAHVQDLSGRQELVERMACLADHDALTGLSTRRRFDEMMVRHRQTMARDGARGALLLIDLDRFKAVNDTFGHLAGDDVLKRVAAVLRGRVRVTDVLARLGGDEFAIILPQADLAQAEVVAADVVHMLKETHTVIGKTKVTVTASVGVVAFADTAGDDNPVASADAAMYRAKRAGGNRWMAGISTNEQTCIPFWVGRVLSGRGAQATIGCAAALFLAARYGHPSGGSLATAHRSLAAALARVLTTSG